MLSCFVDSGASGTSKQRSLCIFASVHKCEYVIIFDFLFLQTIQAALKDEALFFQKNYPALSSRNGTPFLARTLNKVHKS